MKRAIGRRLFPVPILLVALSLLLVSCASWQRTQALSEPAAREKHYARMRVDLVDGPVLFLRNPWFGGDTLYGRTEVRVHNYHNSGPYVKHEKGDTVAIPIERISKLEARRLSGSKTVLALVGVGLTVALVVAVISASNDGPGGGFTGGGGSSGGGGDCCYSCPLIYSWDGEAWRLNSVAFAGAIMQALARTDVGNLDFAQAQDGIVRLRLTGEPGETEHVDAIRLVAVDHDPQCTIAADPGGALHALGSLREPSAAHDFRRRDVLRLVRANDPLSWESAPTARDTARAEDIRDGLEIEFPRAAGATEARLVVDSRYTAWADYLMSQYISLHGRDTGAWYRALAADPVRARAFVAAIAREAFLDVSVWDGAGWRRQAFIPGPGPELLKRQVVRLDLSGLRGATVRVRLEAAPSMWLIDRVAIDFGPERGFVAKEIAPREARDSGGRDILANLDLADGQAEVLESQDSMELSFVVDPMPSGRARSYLTATTGWYRIHTSESGDPDWALAERLIREPRAMSRHSVARLNEALQSMAAAGR
jgi:hypothetical protein